MALRRFINIYFDEVVDKIDCSRLRLSRNQCKGILHWFPSHMTKAVMEGLNSRFRWPNGRLAAIGSTRRL